MAVIFSIMSTVARKRSTRSSKDEDTFVVDDEDAPSLGDEKIGRHEEWSSVIETLYKVGWKWKKGPGLLSYVYLKPHIDTIKDKRQNIDYFIDESHLKEYVAVKYNWKGEIDEPTKKEGDSSTLVNNTTRKSSKRSRISLATPPNTSARIKLQKLDNDDDSYNISSSNAVNIFLYA